RERRIALAGGECGARARVVADRHHGRPVAGWGCQRIAYCSQIAPPVAPVGFEMAAFSPLVPRVDEHQALAVGEPPPRLLDERVQPVLKERRGRANEHHPVEPPSRGVVPARHDATKQRPVGRWLVERLNYQVAIVEDVTPEFALGDLQLRVQPIRLVAVWWKLHGRVEAKRFRICDGGYAGGAEVEIAQSEASCF